MALQPVAVGVNGEIGYIAVQQPNPEGTLVTAGTADMTMEPPNYMNNMFSQPSPSHNGSGGNVNRNIQGITQGCGGPFGGPNSIDGPAPSQEALRLESERMKHELEVLQQKISCLNTARMNSLSGGNGGGGTESQVGSIGGTSVESNHGAENNGVVTTLNETAQLTSELQLIENTIKDREREIIINRNTDMTHNATDGAANLEYGSYLVQGM